MTVEGQKFDSAKNRLELIPSEFIEEIGSVLTSGAEKYGARNWEKGLEWGRIYGATLRHLFAWWRKEELDPETGKSHLIHAACNILFLFTYQRENKGEDNRR